MAERAPQEMTVVKVKVCLVGPGSVGKTSLIRRFVHDEFDDQYIITMGAKVSKKELTVNDEGGTPSHVDMMIWDIMGQADFQDPLKGAFFKGATRAFFDGADGILAVCDVTRKNTLHQLRSWVAAVQDVAGDIPVHFLANKVDLTDQVSFEEEELRGVAEEHGSPYSYTSAKTGENVQLAFQRLAERIV